MAHKKFAAADLAHLGEALYMAEESVSDHYHLSQHAWAKYPYEVRTLAELMDNEINGQALAQVVRMRQPKRPGRLRGWDFYRVCVQDHNVLRALERESASELLTPLLTYVLAHELVHVVRFYKFDHLFEATAAQRGQEEMRVHDITAGILSKVKLDDLAKVINLYREYGTDDWSQVPVYVAQGDEHADLRI